MNTQLDTAVRSEVLKNSRWIRSLGFLSTILFLFTACPLLAQMMPRQMLTHAFTLEREGKPAPAIAELQALLDSKSLDDSGVGKAWNVLGLAFQDQGNFSASQNAYEHSIRSFEGLPNNISDYAMALDDFGGLYVDTRQFELALGLRVKALHLYEQINDHTGIANASCDLAGLEFSRNKINDGKRYLERALKESKLTKDLDDDDRAAIASMQGWLAQLNNDFLASASSYRQSLDWWRKRHGEEHPYTGWGYILLGNAHAGAGELTTGLNEMKQGIAILSRTLSSENPRYLTAEIAYARVLDETGAHSEAARTKTIAERQLKEFYSSQCLGCTISATAFTKVSSGAQADTNASAAANPVQP